MDLFRFNVSLLLIAPSISERFGSRRDVVGTQVDVAPIILGRLGGEALGVRPDGGDDSW
ncbi:hypothetical protein [Pseudomonas fluorescens]|uniref:Uncharacterized protein n=1 Tax=Pseudomonas fluorescens TaxID=294 RepID=A0A5E7C048_PSEFL|nr:hypothetical protein PS723_02420 [Pseudomonas fluorescens]